MAFFDYTSFSIYLPKVTLETLPLLSQWEEPIILLSGIELDPSFLLATLCNQNPILAGRCLIEGEKPNKETAIFVIVSLLNHFNSTINPFAAWLLYTIFDKFPDYSVSFNELLGASTPLVQIQTKARIYKFAGRYLQQTGKWQDAGKLYVLSEELLEGNNRDGLLDCDLAMIYSEKGDLEDIRNEYDIAKGWHEKAIEKIKQKQCTDIEAAEIYKRYGINLRYDEAWEDARKIFEEALRYTEAAEIAFPERSKSIKGEILMGIGKLFLEQDKFREALHYFQNADNLFQEIYDDYNRAQSLHKIGEAYLGLATITDLMPN